MCAELCGITYYRMKWLCETILLLLYSYGGMYVT